MTLERVKSKSCEQATAYNCNDSMYNVYVITDYIVCNIYYELSSRTIIILDNKKKSYKKHM